MLSVEPINITKPVPILERIERWVDYAGWQGIPLERILVHPSDYAAAPRAYQGLPVVVMSR